MDTILENSRNAKVEYIEIASLSGTNFVIRSLCIRFLKMAHARKPKKARSNRE